MRYVFWKNHKTLIRNIIFFIMGIYTGIIICLNFYGNQIDELMENNNVLLIELDSCKNENAALEKENKEKSSELIRTVKFNFINEMDTFNQTELTKTLMEETHFLIGKKVTDVSKSPEFIYQLLNGKIYSAKEKKYKIDVEIIYIQSSVEIWISTKEQKL